MTRKKAEPRPSVRSFCLPAKCPNCGGTETKVERTLASLEHGGTEAITGRPYSRVDMRVRSCPCGQCFTEREFILSD